MALVVYDPQQGTGTQVNEDQRYVGLSNQGATCYLNGLLQTLYMTPEFRSAMFQWNYDKEKHGDEEFCIPLQLQKLFGFMMLSKQRAVDTIALTKSFGWEGAEVFQQQDVQELTRVLFDALEESFKGTPSEKILDKLYAGQTVSYLRCIDVNYESEKVEEFLDLSMAIVNPFGNDAPCNSLNECIETYLQPEILDGDNKYHVEEFNVKATTLKGLKFLHLPKLLSLHLKRFIPDYTSYNMATKKINDPVEFPMVLDMNKYIAKRKEERPRDLSARRRASSMSSTGNRSRRSSDGSIEVPLGTSPGTDGGRNSLNSRGSIEWKEESSFHSDSGKLRDSLGSAAGGGGASEREFEEGEEFELFLQEQIDRLKEDAAEKEASAAATAAVAGEAKGGGEVASSSSSSSSSGGAGDSGTTPGTDDTDNGGGATSGIGKGAGAGAGAGDRKEEGEVQVEEKVDMGYTVEDIPHLLRTRGPWIYELYAVLIHSGSVNGGHYYAYIKDLDHQQWWNFNDSSVSRIDEETVKQAWGRTYGAASYAGPATPAATNIYGGVSGGSGGAYSHSVANKTSSTYSSANAYMLMYRKVADRHSGETATLIPDSDAVPAYIQSMVLKMEEEIERKRREDAERLNRLNVTVHYGNVERKVLLTKTQTLCEALGQLRTEFKVHDGDKKEKDEEGDASEPGPEPEPVPEPVPVPLARMRLRDYSLHSKMATNAYEVEDKGQRTLGSLTFYDHKHISLEVLEEGAQWEPWYENGVSVSLQVYDEEGDTLHSHSLRLPKDSTLSHLRMRARKLFPAALLTRGRGGTDGEAEAEAEDVGMCVRLYKVTERYNAGATSLQNHVGEILPRSSGAKRLREDLNVYESTKIFADLVPANSSTLAAVTGAGKGEGEGEGEGEESKEEPGAATSDKTETLTGETSKAIACFLEAKNRISVRINCPPSTTNDHLLAINLTWSIETLRENVVALLNEVRGPEEDPFTVDKTRMFKMTVQGVELKLGDDSALARLHLTPNMNLVVSRGEPFWLGMHRLKVSVFEPRDWPVTQWGVVTPPEVPEPEPEPESEPSAEPSAHTDKATGSTPVVVPLAADTGASDGVAEDTEVVPEPVSVEAEALDPAVVLVEAEVEAEPVGAPLDEPDTESIVETKDFPAPAASAASASAEAEAEIDTAVTVAGPSGMSFGQASSQFITSAYDYRSTDVVVSAKASMRIEELRQVVYQRMRDAGIFSDSPPANLVGDVLGERGGASGSSSTSTSTSSGIFALDDDEADHTTSESAVGTEVNTGTGVVGDRKQGRYSHVTGPEYIRLRVPSSNNAPPGSILRDGSTLQDSKLSLFNVPTLATQILSQPEALPKQEAGDVVVLAQMWHRSSWTLGTRREVFLSGDRTVLSVARGLCVMFGVESVGDLRVLRLSKQGSDVYLHKLDSDTPASSAYNPTRWFDPTANGTLKLRDARDLSLGDGDLLILQDASETLRVLTEEELRGIAMVSGGKHGEFNSDAFASLDVPSYGSNYFHNSTINPVAGSKSTGFLASGGGSGVAGAQEYKPWRGTLGGSSSSSSLSRSSSGIKIKKLSDRIKEEQEKERAEAERMVKGAGAGAGAADSGGGSETIATAADEAEFTKTGGVALFEDMA